MVYELNTRVPENGAKRAPRTITVPIGDFMEYERGPVEKNVRVILDSYLEFWCVLFTLF